MQRVRDSEVPDSMCLLLVDRRLEALDRPRDRGQPLSIKVACVCCLQTAAAGPLDSTQACGQHPQQDKDGKRERESMRCSKARPQRCLSASCAGCRLPTSGPAQR